MMNTWLLIIAQTFYAHSTTDPTIITFQEFNTQERCLQMKEWIDKRFGNSRMFTRCIEK